MSRAIMRLASGRSGAMGDGASGQRRFKRRVTAVALGVCTAAVGGCFLGTSDPVGLGLGGTRCGSEVVMLYSDVGHCGACFQACAAEPGETAWCAGSQCYSARRLAAEQDGPDQLVVTATHVYWTSNCGGSIMRVGKDGGEPEVVALGQFAVRSVAVDDSRAYWAMACPGGPGSCCVGPTQVASVPLAGGQPAALSMSGSAPALAIALGAQSVYWTIAGEGIWMASTSHGDVLPLLDYGTFGHIALDETYLYVSGQLGDGFYDVYRIPRTGGDPTSLTYSQYVLGLAVHNGYVYWVNLGARGDYSTYETALMRAPLDGGPPVWIAEAAPSSCSRPSHKFAVDDARVYLTSPNSLWTVPLTGVPPEPLALARLPDLPIGPVAIDEASVYFVLGDSVMKMPKP